MVGAHQIREEALAVQQAANRTDNPEPITRILLASSAAGLPTGTQNSRRLQLVV